MKLDIEQEICMMYRVWYVYVRYQSKDCICVAERDALDDNTICRQ